MIQYRWMMALGVIVFVGSIAYDAHWVISGRFGTDSYVPGVYPLASGLVLAGMRLAKIHGLWSPISSKEK